MPKFAQSDEPKINKPCCCIKFGARIHQTFTPLEIPTIYDGDDIINRISPLLKTGLKPHPF